MKYRVTTYATVERVYLVNAADKKDAIQASTEATPYLEHTMNEEITSVQVETEREQR